MPLCLNLSLDQTPRFLLSKILLLADLGIRKVSPLALELWITNSFVPSKDEKMEHLCFSFCGNMILAILPQISLPYEM